MLSYYDFRDLVVDGADRYLRFLDSKKGTAGMDVVEIESIEPHAVPGQYVFWLKTTIHYAHAPNYELWFQGVSTEIVPKPAQGLEITRCNSSKGRCSSVIVQDVSGKFSPKELPKPGDYSLVSDMRFLIRRLRDFYLGKNYALWQLAPFSISTGSDSSSSDHADQITLLPPLPDELLAPFSQQQLDAYNLVFSAPFSYVHGAPGTGKTNMVLSRCILRYTLSGKRVMLLAPTNNALDQMLRGILPVLDSAGVPLEKVYRLGVPSFAFAREYPQVVGDTAATNLMAELEKEEALTSQQLQALEQQLAEVRKKLAGVERCAKAYEAMQENIISLLDARSQIPALQRQSDTLSRSLAISTSAAEQLLQELSLARKQAADCSQEIQNGQGLLKSFRALFWSKTKRQTVQAAIDAREQELPQLRSNAALLQAKYEAHSSAVQSQSKENARCALALSQAEALAQALTQELFSAASFDAPFSQALEQRLQSSFEEDPVLAYIAKSREESGAGNAVALEEQVTALRSRLDEIAAERGNLSGNAKMIQFKNALVLAATIDSCYSAISSQEIQESDLPISHVFLDEAGYTSLARCVVAFCPGAPVTFLGDHHQLPPICEMNRIDPSDATVSLFALSAAYLPDLLHFGMQQIYSECYASKNPLQPSFQGTAFAELTHSYRFGQGLAQVLGKYIYGPSFSGVEDAPFEICYLDAPFFPDAQRWTSRSEANTIRAVLEGTSIEEDALAVLSPYNHQVSLLRRKLPMLDKDSILTVHRAQGREWDTVILSIVDTDSPFLTDSSWIKGQSVLCTALSRAKRRLILVCDSTRWEKDPQQMISHLIEHGVALKDYRWHSSG